MFLSCLSPFPWNPHSSLGEPCKIRDVLFPLADENRGVDENPDGLRGARSQRKKHATTFIDNSGLNDDYDVWVWSLKFFLVNDADDR